MKLTLKNYTLSRVIILLLFTGIASLASANATITKLRGFVTAESALGSRTLAKGDTVNAGETIRTANRSSATLKFDDQSQIILRQKTTFEIAKFSFDGTETEDSEMELVIREGALEAISGLIGKLFPKQYRLSTPISTIGIRGTSYQVEVIRPSNGGPVEVRVATLSGAIVYSSVRTTDTNLPLPEAIDPSADISELTVTIDDKTNQIESVVLAAGNNLSQSERSEVALAIGNIFTSQLNNTEEGVEEDTDTPTQNDDNDSDQDDQPAPGSAID